VDPREIVAAGYDAVAERYARLEETEWPRMRWLRDLLDRLPDGAHVLDLGCGNGVPAGREIARQHTVTGVDVSERQIELARRNVPGGVFFHGDMARVSFPPATFDAVVSFYAIGCIPRAEHADLLRRIRGWLRPGGWLLLSEEDADRPDVVGEWLGVPMFFSGFDAATQRRLVAEAGFAVERSAVEIQVEQGVEIPFAWLLARVQE
jgi:SAM-dependent methyltransferase